MPEVASDQRGISENLAKSWNSVRNHVKDFILMVSGKQVEIDDFDMKEKIGGSALASLESVILAFADFKQKLSSEVKKITPDQSSSRCIEMEIDTESVVGDVETCNDTHPRGHVIMDVSSGDNGANKANICHHQSDTTEDTVKSPMEVENHAKAVKSVSPPIFDLNLVQVKASKQEIERRISAFIEQKQNQVNETNRREFCCAIPDTDETADSCARTDAVFVARASSKSHLKVSRVVNTYGPQTSHIMGPGIESASTSTSTLTGAVKQEAGTESLEERVSNMEAHLKVKGPSKSSMFSRIKYLEERILYLEGISPEYFNVGPPVIKRFKKDPEETMFDDQYKELSLAEIDSNIQRLKESLLQKSAAG